MRGSWNAPEATAAALRDGWLWMGDLAEMDTSGFGTLRDRSKDLIISGGSNIPPGKSRNCCCSIRPVLMTELCRRLSPA